MKKPSPKTVLFAIVLCFAAVSLFAAIRIAGNEIAGGESGREVLNVSLIASRNGFEPERIVADRSKYWAINISAMSIDVTHSFKIDGIAYAYLPVGKKEQIFINITGLEGNYTYYSDIYAGPGVKLEGRLEVI